MTMSVGTQFEVGDAARPLRSQRWLRALVAGVALLAVATGCGGDGGSSVTDPIEPTVIPESTTVVAAAPATPTPEPTPEPQISAVDLYREISPSIGFVETEEGSSGSGVLIEGGYLLTNHHVPELADTVRVVFPNGTEILEAPVFARDMHADLALVGPLDTALPQIALQTQEPPEAGELVYLLGYPDEEERYPDVTLTQGIVSRLRFMELHQFGFIQVDALIAGGQSGGALMNADGELIGISGLRFGVGNFGLVMDARTVHTALEDLLTGGDDFSRPSVGDNPDVTVPRDQPAAFSLTTLDGSVDITATSDGDISLELVTLSGVPPQVNDGPIDYFRAALGTATEVFADDTLSGEERIDVQVDPGTYVVSIGSFETEAVEVELDSSVELFEYVESDEGLTLEAGEVSYGTYGQFQDSDMWWLDLTEGTTIQIQIDSISDPVAVLRLDDEVVASGDDDGFGIFGTGVDMRHTVTETGTYQLAVGRYGTDTGGYAILLTEE